MTITEKATSKQIVKMLAGKEHYVVAMVLELASKWWVSVTMAEMPYLVEAAENEMYMVNGLGIRSTKNKSNKRAANTLARLIHNGK